LCGRPAARFLKVNPLTAVRYRPQMAARPRALPGAAAVGAQIAKRWDADIVDADTVSSLTARVR
jgi:hypothetical protein